MYTNNEHWSTYGEHTLKHTKYKYSQIYASYEIECVFNTYSIKWIPTLTLIESEA